MIERAVGPEPHDVIRVAHNALEPLALHRVVLSLRDERPLRVAPRHRLVRGERPPRVRVGPAHPIATVRCVAGMFETRPKVPRENDLRPGPLVVEIYTGRESVVHGLPSGVDVWGRKM